MASKKPAITGVARPQGWIDDTLKAIGKRMRKPAEITVNKGVSSSSVKKTTYGLKEQKKGMPLSYKDTKVKINSRPKVYNETYAKGTKEYKDALKGQRRNESALKKVNKPNPASKKRGVEYEKALQAEKELASRKWSDMNPDKFTSARKTVREFKYSSPRRVKKGK
jgi:hypothetical protein